MFYYSPYYMTLGELLERHLGDARKVLEIGAADGIVAMAWDRIRQKNNNDRFFMYWAVEPVLRMVEIASSGAHDMRIRILPCQGDLQGVVSMPQLMNAHID